MMKKRNVAMAMAAVTAASSVAPAFAAGTVSSVEKEIFSKSEKSSLVSELSRLSKIVYAEGDDLAGQSAYDILIKSGDTTTKGNLKAFVETGIDTESYTINQFKTDINNLSKDMKVYVIDKGYTTLSDGSISSKKKATYTSYAELVAVNKLLNGKTVSGIAISSEIVNGQVKVTLSSGSITKTIYIKQGDNKIAETLSFVDSSSQPTTDISKIKKFAEDSAVDIESNYKNEDEIEVSAGDGVATIYTIKAAQTETAAVSDLYDGYRLTAKGNEVKNGLSVELVDYTYSSTTGLYTIKAIYTNESGTSKELKVTSKSLSEITDLKDALNGNATVATVSGNTRYTTAVAIAEENKAANIVLVNSSAIVDGLAASPLAKATDSSILLTDRDTLQADTLAYIEDMIEAGNTPEIRIVGGTSAISSSVETKLKNLVGSAKVERIAGDNRHETSLKVAQYLEEDENIDISNAFVVGANGEADAMSIAGYAASIDAPIIVNGFDGMSADALEFLDNVDVDIIGGTTAVSTELEKQLKDVDYDGEVVRVEGKTRYETNANVIETYFGNNIDKVYLAKDGVAKKDQLVDALAAGPLMAKENAPIILATDSISDAQEETLSDNVNYGVEVTQIGGGVGLSVIKKLVNLLGL